MMLWKSRIPDGVTGGRRSSRSVLAPNFVGLQLTIEYFCICVQEHVNDLLNLYLGMPDVRTGILGLSGESIRTTSRKWLDRILEAERVYYQQKLGHRKAGPKTKFRVLIAIKMALDESALIVINNRLKSEGLNVKTREFSGSARGDERLPILSIQQISVCFSPSSTNSRLT